MTSPRNGVQRYPSPSDRVPTFWFAWSASRKTRAAFCAAVFHRHQSTYSECQPRLHKNSTRCSSSSSLSLCNILTVMTRLRTAMEGSMFTDGDDPLWNFWKARAGIHITTTRIICHSSQLAYDAGTLGITNMARSSSSRQLSDPIGWPPRTNPT